MAVAVQAQLVPGREQFADQRRGAADLLADQEEGRPHAVAGEHLEHRRGALGVGAVVEGEVKAATAAGAILDAERRPQPRQHGTAVVAGEPGQGRERVARQSPGGEHPRDRCCAAAMIDLVHAGSDARDRGRDRVIDLLQPRDRLPGDRRQAGSPRAVPARGAAARAAAPVAVAVGHGPDGARLAAAGAGAVAGAAGGRAAGAGDGPAGAAGGGRTDARRARRAHRAHRDGGDRAGGRGGRAVRSAGLPHPHLRGGDDHARARRPRPGEPDPLRPAPDRAPAAGADDALRRARVRVERDRHQAGLRRPHHRTHLHRRAVGAVDAARLDRRSAERDERAAANAPRSRSPRSCS